MNRQTVSRAFTLIELLVVIAIIAILAAILFPVFAQAKFAAKKTIDVSNTRQIGLATKLYLADNEDTMPIFYAYNSDPSIYSPAGHRGTEQLLLAYTKAKDIFKSPLDNGGPYLANETGTAKGAPTYWNAYGTSYRFGHCAFSTVANESSQNNSFQVYDPRSATYNQTVPITESSFEFPSETRIIRLEMFGTFAKINDPDCTRYGYDCGYFQNWDPSGGTMVFSDGHSKHVVGTGGFDSTRVDPTGHRSGEPSTDPNAWSSSWYSLCD
jgi:prepilin-type N-terminal cleavage/methylation domain-containing protein